MKVLRTAVVGFNFTGSYNKRVQIETSTTIASSKV